MTRNKKLVRLMAATIAATTVATSMPALAAFDANYYAKQNPDVVAAVGTTPKALENHYNTFGKRKVEQLVLKTLLIRHFAKSLMLSFMLSFIQT